MRRNLWIQGLSLQANEVTLRWLLIQRYRYWRRYRPDIEFNGWFVHGPTEVLGALDDERRVFLESVGLRIIELRPRLKLAKVSSMYDEAIVRKWLAQI